MFQQFQGGVITAWNTPCDPGGTPSVGGNNGSAGPLGVPTNDVNPVGDLLVSTFEHGKIEYNPKTDQVEVTVNGKVIPRRP